MAASISELRNRLTDLRTLRRELDTIKKEAFMAAPPMPGGGAPPMDPAMMQGGMPPVDPATGMPMGAPPIDPATGMPMGGAPPAGMPPVDPATGMPMGAPPAGMPPAPPAPPADQLLTPEMLEQILGVIEELAAANEQQQQVNQQLTQGLEDLAAQVDELNQRLSTMAAIPQ